MVLLSITLLYVSFIFSYQHCLCEYGKEDMYNGTLCLKNITTLYCYTRYRDGVGNTVEENSSVFSLIQMR